MKQQRILYVSDDYEQLDMYLQNSRHKKILLVCGASAQRLKMGSYFDTLEERMGIQVIQFSDFTPNPLYESVEKGVKVLRDESCSMIVALGGGSAMDVAKCIKLFAGMDASINYLEQTVVLNDIELMAVPTTAGTGSEATRYAVIYYKGEKQSVTDTSCIPDVVIFDPSVLKTLPLYQKKATMMDALCHATESFWSINSNEESREYAKKAIKLVLTNYKNYLANDDTGNAGMLKAANLAGKAINISQTTAGHAMCYKLTSLYGIAHGHAAALCVRELFGYMQDNMDKCRDSRGCEYLKEVFEELAHAYDCQTPAQASWKFAQICRELELATPDVSEKEYEILVNSVNPVRLKNNPVELDSETIDYLYHQISQKTFIEDSESI